MPVFYEESVLPNGVRVLTEAVPGVRSTALGIWIGVGSRDEGPGEEGMSHFMEHMLFKGTDTRTAADISFLFDGMGAELNAFTTREYTCFYARFVDGRLDEAFEALADMVARSTFMPEEVESEREVVLEEIASCEDMPDDYVFDLFAGELYGEDSPLGRPILGTRDSVEGFTREGLVGFHHSRYTSARMVVSAAGSVDHGRVKELAARYLGDVSSGESSACANAGAGPVELRVAENPMVQPGVVVARRDIEQAHLVIGSHALSASDPDSYAASLLDIAFGGGTSSRLFQEVRERRGLVYEIESSLSSYRDTGSFTVYAGTRPANLPEVLAVIREEAGRMVAEGISADELERACSYAVGQLIMSMEATRVRMERLGRRAVMGLEMRSLDESISAYERVTVEDVARAAERLLAQDPTIAVVGPVDEGTVYQ